MHSLDCFTFLIIGVLSVFNASSLSDNFILAILSVWDKSGLLDFARGLHELGFTILASGGTSKAIQADGTPVTEVGDFTKAPELIGGRVKTLHPAIHAGKLKKLLGMLIQLVK